MKRANGEGSYRYIDAKQHWQGRIMIDGHTHTCYGKTMDEVRRKIMDIRVTADAGNLPAPCKLTVREWLLVWLDTYCKVKPSSRAKYESVLRNHIIPAIGDVKLQKLTSHQVQGLYNQKEQEGKSAKTIKDIHGVLHKGLAKAVQVGYLQRNVSDVCEVKRYERKEMRPIWSTELPQFLQAIKGTRYEELIFVALATGMRQGELLGLTWDCVDLKSGIIRLHRQLCPPKNKGEGYYFGTLKNSKSRKLWLTDDVVASLRKVQAQQQECKEKAGDLWDNPEGLVFTNETGGHLCHFTVLKHFKKIVTDMGLPEVRFHDLRHTFAVLSLETGADMKSVSKMMGHATVAFTMDMYGHMSETMGRENAQRMQNYFDALRK